MFGDLFILSGFAAAFVAGLFWMAALAKCKLSFAYPFMTLAFILVLVLSVLLFDETMSLEKVTELVLTIFRIFPTVKL